MDISKLDDVKASRLVCLFLAQSEEPKKPFEQLGFKTSRGAFLEIGLLFGRKENTIKNIFYRYNVRYLITNYLQKKITGILF